MEKLHKGGRHIPAPYKTTHARIPVTIKPTVEKLTEVYKRGVLFDGADPDIDPGLGVVLSKEQAIELANQCLNQKLSARKALAKLLTAMYNETIKPEDLTRTKA